MHSLVRRFLKTGIAFLTIGLGIGVWLVGERELVQRHASPYAVSAHTHAILVGFVMMMILGVALWLFPRPSGDDTRYDPRAAAVAYWLLTVGTATRIVGELARMTSTAPLLRIAVFAASLLQVAGIVVFFYTMWSRIRPAGSRVREQQGERF